MLVVLAMVTLGVALAGCASQVPVKPPAVSFADRNTIGLDVATIDIVDQYRSPMAKPNVEQLAPNPPGQAVRRWAAERLRAVGRSGSAQIIILDASIVESQLAREQGITAYFTTQQAQRYDGRVEVKIVCQSPTTGLTGYAQATASRSSTVPEGISLAGREEAWDKLVRGMMEDLDSRLSHAVQDGLGPMLRPH
ncbi:MAG: hypothetical protein WCO00_00330 [Rhodospirillaceae bacterium]